MDDLDKQALGERIRKIRADAGLRQWELARRLGTTQSAVHKYEHGVVPEPRRLVELARIGNTSLEWILTGRHWENGSEQKERVAPELLATACDLRALDPGERGALRRALRVTKEAVAALSHTDAAPEPGALRAALAPHAAETLAVLEAAWRIQSAVLRRLARDEAGRLGGTPGRAEDGGSG
jgi:transcriptional regulator with XRE-family HTH domain